MGWRARARLPVSRSLCLRRTLWALQCLQRISHTPRLVCGLPVAQNTRAFISSNSGVIETLLVFSPSFFSSIVPSLFPSRFQVLVSTPPPPPLTHCIFSFGPFTQTPVGTAVVLACRGLCAVALCGPWLNWIPVWALRKGHFVWSSPFLSKESELCWDK